MNKQHATTPVRNTKDGLKIAGLMLLTSATLIAVQILLINLAAPNIDVAYMPAGVPMYYPMM